MLGIILTEVLQGVRDKNRFDKLKEALAPFPLIEPERQDYVHAAEIRNRCQEKGIQASTIDFLIASYASRRQMPLLSTDLNFDRIATVVPLKLEF